MAKSADAFRTISEVADWLETPAHVLRFWESKFSQIKPVKRAGGRRYYRPSDMLLLGGIKKLLHVDGMTIKGVQKLLREHGVKHVATYSQPLDDITAAEVKDAVVDAEVQVVSPPAETVAAFQKSEKETPKPKPVAENPVIASSETEPREPDQQDQAATAAPDKENAGEIAANTDATPPSPQDDSGELPDDTPVMPSFSHRRATDDTEREAQEPDSTPPPAPEVTKPDLPDDPADDIPAESGVLAEIAGIRPPISGKTAKRLTPILDRLRGYVSGNGFDGT